jgi:hypothetical protein
MFSMTSKEWKPSNLLDRRDGVEAEHHQKCLGQPEYPQKFQPVQSFFA